VTLAQALADEYDAIRGTEDANLAQWLVRGRVSTVPPAVRVETIEDAVTELASERHRHEVTQRRLAEYAEKLEALQAKLDGGRKRKASQADEPPIAAEVTSDSKEG
jgi:hypothetical protein